MTTIISEAQAERIGERETGGKRDVDFTVFQYVHNRSNLTLFGVRTNAGRVITASIPHPRAAVPAQTRDDPERMN